MLRWFDEDGTMIPLSLFLPVLNENSYIRYVDQWCLSWYANDTGEHTKGDEDGPHQL